MSGRDSGNMRGRRVIRNQSSVISSSWWLGEARPHPAPPSQGRGESGGSAGCALLRMRAGKHFTPGFGLNEGLPPGRRCSAGSATCGNFCPKRSARGTICPVASAANFSPLAARFGGGAPCPAVIAAHFSPVAAHPGGLAAPPQRFRDAPQSLRSMPQQSRSTAQGRHNLPQVRRNHAGNLRHSLC